MQPTLVVMNKVTDIDKKDVGTAPQSTMQTEREETMEAMSCPARRSNETRQPFISRMPLALAPGRVGGPDADEMRKELSEIARPELERVEELRSGSEAELAAHVEAHLVDASRGR